MVVFPSKMTCRMIGRNGGCFPIKFTPEEQKI